MKHFWLLLLLSAVLGTTLGWTMNYVQYGHRKAYFGEITMDGSVTADNVMEKLKEYHRDAVAVAELEGDATYDFGVMPPGTQGNHTFVVKNSGDEPLSLELGATTCKCTLGDLDQNELAPGESTTVKLEWTVASDKSEFTQSAELRTNDPLRPAIKLTVQGLVISDLEFDPKKVSFGSVTAGESFEFSTNLYSYYDNDIKLIKGRFGSDDLTELADVSFEEFEPSESDGVHKRAHQAFKINTKVKPGLRQGPMLTTMLITFEKLGQEGSESVSKSRKGDKDGEKDDYVLTAVAECAGRVVGSLTMLENAKLKSSSGGGYIWTLGRISEEDPLEFKALVALKGSERDSTNLTIGETHPSDVIQAEIGKPLGKGSMRLFPLKITLKPGEKTIDLLGKNKDDFGWLWIESDNPKVSRMKVAVKVMIEPRP